MDLETPSNNHYRAPYNRNQLCIITYKQNPYVGQSLKSHLSQPLFIILLKLPIEFRASRRLMSMQRCLQRVSQRISKHPVNHRPLIRDATYRLPRIDLAQLCLGIDIRSMVFMWLVMGIFVMAMFMLGVLVGEGVWVLWV